jgi:hypothetical protein
MFDSQFDRENEENPSGDGENRVTEKAEHEEPAFPW